MPPGDETTSTTVTLAERKSAQAARLCSGVERVLSDLAEHARRCGGRYVVFGSCVTGEIRFDSDLDLLLDFPAESSADAWCFAEMAAAQHKVPLDLHDARTSRPAFVERVMRQGRVLA